MGVCDDPISRQDAITIPVLPKAYREYQTMNLDDAYELGWFDCQKCIEDLPTALLEFDVLNEAHNEGYDVGYWAGRRDYEPRWIPVSERLPEKDSDPEKYLDRWLCCTSNGDIMILFYGTPGDGTEECAFYKWDDDGYFYQTFDVIAWMPIPKPYNEGT